MTTALGIKREEIRIYTWEEREKLLPFVLCEKAQTEFMLELLRRAETLELALRIYDRLTYILDTLSAKTGSDEVDVMITVDSATETKRQRITVNGGSHDLVLILVLSRDGKSVIVMANEISAA